MLTDFLVCVCILIFYFTRQDDSPVSFFVCMHYVIIFISFCVLGLWQNMQLLTDARAARMYRDELDAVKERAIRADKLENEVARFREKLHNMNFYKVKLEVCIAT